MPPSGPDSGADGAAPSSVHTAAAAGIVVVVSDAGPLISLARLDLLTVLQCLFEEVQVPGDVVVECMARPGNTDTLGDLACARRRGLVGPVVPLIGTLRASGQRLSHQVVAQALADVGEVLP